MPTIKRTSNAELLSYIINQTPALKADLNLPVQGQSTAEIGKLIIGNPVYRNAFINTINLIGLTVIKRNGWDNPWEWFTNKGTLRFGQQIREMIVDLANVYDYNANSNDNDRFLETVVPNVLSYIHEVNFQKFYQTTTSDMQMSMAFTEENGLYNLIMEIVGSLYESLKYDQYITNKYMLCRRIVDGTLAPSYIADYNSLSVRERVSRMKAVANKMTFRNPNYNPAGIRKANRMEDLILIMNTDFESSLSTEVLATSYFRNDAEFKTNGVLIDGFGNHDSARLTELLGDSYTPFTGDELSALANIPAVIVSSDWFMDYYYDLGADSGVKSTEFYNPVTHKNNHFLSCWMVMSTSPFEQGTVFTLVQPSVSSVTITPSTATVTKGQELKLSGYATTAGFGNKAVSYALNQQAITSGATIDETGLLKVPSDYTTASGTQGVYNLTVSTALATNETITIDGIEYKAAAAADTAAKQATAIYTQLAADTKINSIYTITNPSSGVVRFTEASGYYGYGVPVVDDSELETGAVTMATGTEGKEASTPIVVTATSVLDKSQSADARITVA